LLVKYFDRRRKKMSIHLYKFLRRKKLFASPERRSHQCFTRAILVRKIGAKNSKPKSK
jgi:hypothetical protein